MPLRERQTQSFNSDRRTNSQITQSESRDVNSQPKQKCNKEYLQNDQNMMAWYRFRLFWGETTVEGVVHEMSLRLKQSYG